jgi:hypothetical protein
MIDANSQFFAVLTDVGAAKQANANALGIPWKLTHMGVGDANNSDPIPSSKQTKLINEWRRRPLNQLRVDPVNSAVIIAEQIIPADEGGRWIREIGLYDEAGDLVAVANCAPSFKPILSQGSGRTQIIRMNFMVSSTANIELKIDPAVVLATREYVDQGDSKKLPLTGGTLTGSLVAGAGVRTKKGLPKNDGADVGYTFGIDGDSGLFATEGPLPQSGSELVLMADAIELARFGTNKSTIPNAVLPGATAVTPAPGTNTKAVATAEFVIGTVQAAINALVNGAPGAMDTLEELAKALGGDANFAATVTNTIATKLARSGGQMTGMLQGKVGAGGPGNPNNCGIVFDSDTGLFSKDDGEIALYANGEVLLQKHPSGALQALRGFRAPKGPPNQADVSSWSGYTFADDGDTGMFAEGGIANSGSDVVFRIDNQEVGRLKPIMKSSGKNGWARLVSGQILQWCEFTVQHIAGAPAAWSVTFPTTFPVKAMQAMLSLGNGLGASSISYSVENLGPGSASGFAYSSDAPARLYRLWVIGE